VTTKATDMSALLEVFDAALAARKLIDLVTGTGVIGPSSQLILVHASRHPHAEAALRLWASANLLSLEDSTIDCAADRYQPAHSIRALHVLYQGAKLAGVQWDAVYETAREQREQHDGAIA
jgi:hypothetical protein